MLEALYNFSAQATRQPTIRELLFFLYLRLLACARELQEMVKE
jgi:hypothetical protein